MKLRPFIIGLCAAVGIGLAGTLTYAGATGMFTPQPEISQGEGAEENTPTPPDKPGDDNEKPGDKDQEVILPYSFEGSTLTGYSGSATDITLPTSYSFGKIVLSQKIFNMRYERFSISNYHYRRK